MRVSLGSIVGLGNVGGMVGLGRVVSDGGIVSRAVDPFLIYTRVHTP